MVLAMRLSIIGLIERLVLQDRHLPLAEIIDLIGLAKLKYLKNVSSDIV